MCWSTYFFLQEKHENYIQRKDFGFILKNTTPQWEHMEAFEREFLGIISYIKFRFHDNVMKI